MSDKIQKYGARTDKALENSLVRPDIDADLGGKLIDAAAVNLRKRREGVVMMHIQNLIQKAQEAEHAAALLMAEAAFYREQLVAIEAGQFTINPISGLISFNDPALRKFTPEAL